MDPSHRQRAAALFSSMAHPTRISIAELLIEHEMSVGDVAAKLNLGQSSASQHLAVMHRAGIVSATPKGTSRLYRVRGRRIAEILQLIVEFCQVHDLRGEPLDHE